MSTSPYSRIMRAVRSTPWAIQPEKLEAILGFLQLKVEGKAVDVSQLGEIKASSKIAAERAQKVSASSSGSVAVLPLYGVIMHRGNMMGDISGPGGTSVERFTAQFRQAVNDPNVKAIVIDVDSPGGSVEGVFELSDEIYAARGKKKITAVSNCLMASAAYCIACSATEIVATKSSLTGSIGVYCAHEDDSQMLEKAGVKVTLVSAGKYKTEGNPYEPLGDEARAAMQAMVDEFYTLFVKAVARGRGVSADAVISGFGQARVLTANDAKAARMVDRIGTLDDVLAEYGVSRGSNMARMTAQPSMKDRLDAQSAVKADLDDGDGCMCPCGACEMGDCQGCTHINCECAGCTCASASEMRGKREREAMARRIAIETA